MSISETCGKERTIVDMVNEQRDTLRILVNNVDNLVQRNPAPDSCGTEVSQRPDNVFDGIISTLYDCRGLIREATEKVQDGISRKVF